VLSWSIIFWGDFDQIVIAITCEKGYIRFKLNTANFNRKNY
jgi:hypothetical protein